MTRSNLQTWPNFCKVLDTGRSTFWLIQAKTSQCLIMLWVYNRFTTIIDFCPSQPPLSSYPAFTMIIMKNPRPQQLQKLQNQWAKPRGGQKVNTEIKSPFEPHWTKVLQVPRWPTKTCPVRLHPELSEQHGKENSLWQQKGGSWAGLGRLCTHTLRVLHETPGHFLCSAKLEQHFQACLEWRFFSFPLQ